MATITGSSKLPSLADYTGEIVFIPSPAGSARVVGGAVITAHPITTTLTAGSLPAGFTLAEGSYSVKAGKTDSFTITVPSGTGSYELWTLIASGTVNPPSVELGLPAGGTAGQVPVKQSSADGDAALEDLTAGTAFLGTFTVATLPASANTGDLAMCSDALDVTGHSPSLVTWDGSKWVLTNAPGVEPTTEYDVWAYRLYSEASFSVSVGKKLSCLSGFGSGMRLVNNSAIPYYDTALKADSSTGNRYIEISADTSGAATSFMYVERYDGTKTWNSYYSDMQSIISSFTGRAASKARIALADIQTPDGTPGTSFVSLVYSIAVSYPMLPGVSIETRGDSQGLGTTNMHIVGINSDFSKIIIEPLSATQDANRHVVAIVFIPPSTIRVSVDGVSVYSATDYTETLPLKLGVVAGATGTGAKTNLFNLLDISVN